MKKKSIPRSIDRLVQSHSSDALYDIDLTVARQGFFDKKMCWVHARAGAVPAVVSGTEMPLIVMTLQKLMLAGSDTFYALNEMRTVDGGRTWTEPVEHLNFARESFSYDGKDDLEIAVCDFTPGWHAKTGKLLGTGHTMVYKNNHVILPQPRRMPYSVYDMESNTWSKWKALKMPAQLANSGAGCVQRLDLPDGHILLPITFTKIGDKQFSTTVLRCSFDGTEMKYLEHGSELMVPVERGLYEPSIASYKGQYFLTMRNDEEGYVAVSDDGLNYSPAKKWAFDDGEELGSYNTQQHWVSHSDGLFLVYTRKGANNDHVFRSRAPLFIARVDPDRLQVIRESEQVLVPEKGARLGNFGVTQVSENETWVTAAEWMQTTGIKPNDPERLLKAGADNRIWVAKILWKKKNQYLY